MREVETGIDESYTWKPEETQLVCTILCALQRQTPRGWGFLGAGTPRWIFRAGDTAVREGYRTGQAIFSAHRGFTRFLGDALALAQMPQHLFNSLLRRMNI